MLPNKYDEAEVAKFAAAALEHGSTLRLLVTLADAPDLRRQLEAAGVPSSKIELVTIGKSETKTIKPTADPKAASKAEAVKYKECGGCRRNPKALQIVLFS